jgi:hypothetical protein
MRNVPISIRNIIFSYCKIDKLQVEDGNPRSNSNGTIFLFGEEFQRREEKFCKLAGARHPTL